MASSGSNPKDRLRDPVVRLQNSQLSVEPGSEVRTTVTVYNASAVVDELTLEVLGPTAGFGKLIPDRVSLMPGNETTVEVVFSPPAGAATPAGSLPFGVRCVSGVDEYYATVAEGDLDIGAVHALDANLVAVASQGRWVGRYRAEFINHGTAPVTLALAVVSPTEDLGFALAPERLHLDPAVTGEAYLKVRPVRPFLLGGTRRHVFQLAYQRDTVDARQDPTAHGVLQGGFEQKSVASRRLLAVIGGVVALTVAAAVLLWPEENRRELAKAPPDAPTALQAMGTDDPGAILLSWSRSPLAAEYRVEQLRDPDGDDVVAAREIGGEQNAFEWTELDAATEYCFQVVALNDQGESPRTSRSCAVTAAMPVAVGSETPQPDPTDPGTDAAVDTGAGGGSGPTGGEGERSGGDGEGNAADGTAPTASPSPAESTMPPGDPIDGFFVVYRALPMADPANEGALEQRASSLQAAGLPARVIDSETTERYTDGFWVLYRDGFSTHEDARRHCQEDTVRELAPTCFAP